MIDPALYVFKPRKLTGVEIGFFAIVSSAAGPGSSRACMK
jgi:hypothetical protein